MYCSTGKLHSRNIFQRISENVEHHKSEAVKKAKYKNTVRDLKRMFLETYENNPRAENMSIAEFDRIKTIHQGTFSKVELAMRHATGEVFAVKVMSKENMNYEAVREFITNEKRIFKASVHPFLARMRHHFVNGAQLYVVMDYYPAGDLSNLLKQRVTFSDYVARFYAAQMAMALDFLHGVSVAHLNLKLENVLLDQKGYIRLSDMGHAKMFKGRAIMAPEGHENDELIHDFSEDWWDFGVVLYNMIFGKGIHNPDHAGALTNDADIEIQYPSCLSHELRDLFNKLLTRDQSKRLGCTRKGFKAIRKHPWFRPLNWPAVFFKEIDAPYVPTCCPIDCSFMKQFSIRVPRPNPTPRLREEYTNNLHDFLVSVCY